MGIIIHRKLVPVIFLYILNSCAQGSLTISSKPEGSDVILVTSNGQEKSLGKTPLRMGWNDAFDDSKDMSQVMIRQIGYQDSYIMLPKPMIKNSIDLNIHLKEISADPASQQSMKQTLTCETLTHDQMNQLGRGIATAQASILNRDYEVARARLDQLISEFPYVSVLLDLRGNTFFLQKQYLRALDSYEESLRITPGNLETSVMVKRLREITGKTDSR